ncbi:MAG: stage II sporulation protein D [Christensenellales bacterium]
MSNYTKPRKRKKRRNRRGQPSSSGRFLFVCLLAALVLMIALPALLENPAIENLPSPSIGQKQHSESRPAITSIGLYNDQTGQVETLDLDEYVLGVVAAEMPASYPLEALKAQAVAARTLAVYHCQNGGCSKAEGADVCSDFAHCQAYNDEATRKARLGNDYDQYAAILAQAVSETKGEIITYENKPIEVLYHSMSGGQTEDVEHVFSVALPYLRSVDSKGEESNSQYKTTREFSLEEFLQIFQNKYPEANTDAALQNNLTIDGRFDSGRVETVTLYGVSLSGRDMRSLYSLPSTNFEIAISAHTVTITCIGSGHGVGMSQVGARAMAKEGSSYRKILQHYYTGVDIGPL